MTPDRIQFIGHSSLWITLDDLHFLIDPNFSEKILGFVRRHSPIGIDLSQLPDVAALLVTHAHYDHLDIFSYKYFPQNKTIVTPPELSSLINKFLHNPAIELKPWTDWPTGSVKIIAVPAHHFGFRLSGLRYTRCNGYILQGKSHTLYVAGDTAYGPHLKEIGEAFSIDVACLPIGPNRPRWFMSKRHLDPMEALQAFADLKAKRMIPLHWGAFRLGLDRVNENLDQLRGLIHGKPVEEKIKILNPGESIPLEAEEPLRLANRG